MSLSAEYILFDNSSVLNFIYLFILSCLITDQAIKSNMCYLISLCLNMPPPE